MAGISEITDELRKIQERAREHENRMNYECNALRECLGIVQSDFADQSEGQQLIAQLNEAINNLYHAGTHINDLSYGADDTIRSLRK